MKAESKARLVAALRKSKCMRQVKRRRPVWQLSVLEASQAWLDGPDPTGLITQVRDQLRELDG